MRRGTAAVSDRERSGGGPDRPEIQSRAEIPGILAAAFPGDKRGKFTGDYLRFRRNLIHPHICDARFRHRTKRKISRDGICAPIPAKPLLRLSFVWEK
jgi:hypothetical protein